MEMEMEMEMDMEMPNADELEWLANQQDDYFSDPDDQEFPYPVPSPLPSSNPSSDPEPPSQENGGRKRPYPENDAIHIAQIDDDYDVVLGHKRSRLDIHDQFSPLSEDHGAEDLLDSHKYFENPPEEKEKEKEEEKEEEEWVPRRRVNEIEGEWIPITGPSGERVYAKVDGLPSLPTTRNAYANANSGGFLSESINVVIERVEQEMFEQACRATTECINDEANGGSQTANERLWVDKYAPKSFTELLSDEQTNREVLRWLKQWDTCVFGYKNALTSNEVLSALKKHSSPSQSHGSFRKKNFSFMGKRGVQTGQVQDAVNKMDSLSHSNDNYMKFSGQSKNQQACDDRPDEKILLLCGPPGLGKTTLAHVAAKHCGYHVVEINASDDRSASVMERKILDVVQMNSVMADSKPKCLVIDEIDGALGDGKGAVEVLLKMLSSEKKNTSEKDNYESNTQSIKSSKKKGSSKSGRLSRPVICICNDLFAPALRSLRQVARVHTFVQPSTSRVVSRLKYICTREGFKASAQGLTTLAEFSDCDIRACLNTLQFLNRKKELLNVVDIGSQVVGRKDMTSSIFDIWKEILQTRKSKVKVTSLNCREQELQNFTRLHDIISNHGDYELTMDGVHENYLHVRYHDSAMEKTVKCLDYLCDTELLSHCTFRSHHYFLNVYQPSIAIAVHRLIAQVEKPNIEWPKSHQRYKVILSEKKALLNSWLKSMSPTISRYLSRNSIVEDVIPSLLYILSPPSLRPVASRLLSEKEHNQINELVNTMVDYAITYKRGKSLSPHGSHKQDATLDSLELCFDPVINEFVSYKDYTPSYCPLSSAMRQILSHEVEKETILRDCNARSDRANAVAAMLQGISITEAAEAHTGNSNADFFSGERTVKNLSSDNERNKSADSKANPFDTSGLQKSLQSKSTSSAVDSKSKLAGAVKKHAGSFDFFERFKKPSHKGTDNSEKSSGNLLIQRDSRPLLFKFNEGFTNAVKRPVRMRELL